MDALMSFVRDNVALGSTVRTDGSPIYEPLKNLGFGHDAHVILGSKVSSVRTLIEQNQLVCGVEEIFVTHVLAK